MRRQLVLIVEQDQSRARGLAEFCKALDCAVRIASSAADALLLVERESLDIESVILVGSSQNAVMLTDLLRRASAKAFFRAVESNLFVDADGQLVVATSASRPAEPPEILGSSPAMVEVRERIRVAAGSELHVLLTGETGTGKEIAARAIHRLSDRHAKRIPLSRGGSDR